MKGFLIFDYKNRLHEAREALARLLGGADRTQAVLFETRIRHADGRPFSDPTLPEPP